MSPTPPNPLRWLVVVPYERVETLAELTDQEAKRQLVHLLRFLASL